MRTRENSANYFRKENFINLLNLDTQLSWAFNLSDAEFESLYRRKKPRYSDPIIFTCKIGRRALIAAREAISLGFLK